MEIKPKQSGQNHYDFLYILFISLICSLTRINVRNEMNGVLGHLCVHIG